MGCSEGILNSDLCQDWKTGLEQGREGSVHTLPQTHKYFNLIKTNQFEKLVNIHSILEELLSNIRLLRSISGHNTGQYPSSAQAAWDDAWMESD